MAAVIALRYAYVLALSLGFGAAIIVGVVASPVSDPLLHRFFVLSYASGGAVLVSLMMMGLLGPRPSGFAARFGVAAVMLGTTLYAGREARALSPGTLGLILVCALALLFWEARDGTRAA
jgi:hypothetical protein